MTKLDLFGLAVLTRDVPEHDLRAGDVGTVVELLDSTGVILEFRDAAGDTRAVVALKLADVRRGQPHEMLSVRSA